FACKAYSDQITDPVAYVISANVLRRHLNAEQKRELIGKLLKAQPEKSNRQIAKIARADDKTVGTVRAGLEATAEIPQLKKTVGADGKARKQPTKKVNEESPKPKHTSSQAQRELAAKQAHIDDLEAARAHEQGLAEQLQAAKIEIVGLKSEVEELK